MIHACCRGRMFNGAENEMFLWKLNRQLKVVEFMESLSFVVANSLLNVSLVPQLGPSWSLYIPAPQRLRQHHRPHLSAFHDGIRYRHDSGFWRF